jgi:hypothetical protein
MSADSETAIIFQYEEEELEEADITMLVPAIKLPGGDGVLTKVTLLCKTAIVKSLIPLYCMILMTDQVSCKVDNYPLSTKRGQFLKYMMFVGC